MFRSSIAKPLYYETAILGHRDWMLPRAVHPYGSAIQKQRKQEWTQIRIISKMHIMGVIQSGIYYIIRDQFINLVDFSSLAYVAAKSSSNISIAFCLILIIVISMELIIKSQYRNIIMSQPWIITVQLFKFNHNQKKGGLFGCSSGWFRGLHTILLFSIVFCMRELIDWPFCRGVVSVGTSGVIIIIILMKQPFYKFQSNYLTIIPWSIFGSIKICAEIGYAIEEVTHSIVPQIIFLILGFIKKQLKENVAQKFGASFGSDSFSGQNQINLSPSHQFGQQGNKPTNQIQVSSDYNKSGLTQVTYGHVGEPDNRRSPRPSNSPFLLTPSQTSAVDMGFTKVQSVYKLARECQPSLILRFVLYCKTKEGGGTGNDEESAEIILQRAERIQVDKESVGKAPFNNIGMENIGPAAQSGNSSSNTNQMSSFIVFFQYFDYLITFIALVLVVIVYKMEVCSFNIRHDNLYSVCILARAQIKQGIYVKEALHLDLVPKMQDYNFVSILSGDIEMEIIHELEMIRDSLLSYSIYIIDVVENIYYITDDMGPREV
ncbi:MAG: hypothetical protein EZS28_002542 [Streblomastix strix]|uniref:Uncharacterized protein n=1 Tax=Streblomastix strix TaxID=222440 RepID=A0A5J4X597_9EUKA|nr:MAG: hypothetical protein EZS28_002542 [Streblomastix strix]